MVTDEKEKIVVTMTEEEKENRRALWLEYLDYLEGWIEHHRTECYYGMSPASFDEWCDNEYGEEDDE